MSKNRARIRKIEHQLQGQSGQASPWDLASLSDEALHALAMATDARETQGLTDQETLALIPEALLREIMGCYRGQDEQEQGQDREDRASAPAS